ncbi:phosphate:Na+ symporter [Anaerobranca californiensis DSM 14826]|jgi:phosphate:Na+ symporter|uniref:Phosphate:Na+ symporter n=1 Tax=Anaerobranca californiensis DSM 14826 TaxID=1120989 RepID=A0A1M6M4C1_9FIRM|nr:Na/Pi symporter [Anaerobranca californiensis]SHJ78289.1 phosphate:Na+ symporter [Anaerobranca californiensis DSM 14826]
MQILHSIHFVIALGIFLIIIKEFAQSCSCLMTENKRKILLKSQNTLVMVLAGALLSALAQSSSIVVLMVIGLVEGGVISEKNGLAAVLGTEIGTTVTGQLLSIPHKTIFFILPLILIISMVLPKFKNLRKTIFWFALLIISLYHMGLPVKGLTSNSGNTMLRQLLLMANNKVHLAIFIGFAFTALIQSSSALTALAINLGRVGVLEITGALGLILGANLGTCITGVLASFSFSKKAKTIVVGQILFNFLGIIIISIIFHHYVNLVILITPSNLIERQIANGQTLFNALSVIAILPIFPIFYRIVKKFL